MTIDIPQNKILNNSVFWVEVDKIFPNPYQPRKEFDEEALNELAESIKQYGILQPLTVSRKEIDNDDGGFSTHYELIAGERRLKASKLAGLRQVPVVIRVGDDNQTKLELAIIENLQREDLNPIDRALAFDRLNKEFNFKHQEIAKKMGKSREYVSNSMRLLTLPQEIQDALSKGKISEGHTRPLLMLTEKKEEQMTLFREMLIRKMTVREAEALARKVAQDKVRKKQYIKDPNIVDIESELAEKLGTRVHIEKRDVGGVIKIDFFSYDDLENLSSIIKKVENEKGKSLAEKLKSAVVNVAPALTISEQVAIETLNSTPTKEYSFESDEVEDKLTDDRGVIEIKKDDNTDDDDLYNLKNFVI